MINNKKGLSAIITTLLVVVLVLVAVGIVWGVVRNVLTRGAESVEIGGKCMNIDVRATLVSCIGSDCVVTIQRTGTSGDEFAGLKMVFRDSTAGTSSGVIDEIGDVELLLGKTTGSIASGVVAPDSVEITVYFEDASGNEQLCSQTTSRSF